MVSSSNIDIARNLTLPMHTNCSIREEIPPKPPSLHAKFLETRQPMKSFRYLSQRPTFQEFQLLQGREVGQSIRLFSKSLHLEIFNDSKVENLTTSLRKLFMFSQSEKFISFKGNPFQFSYNNVPNKLQLNTVNMRKFRRWQSDHILRHPITRQCNNYPRQSSTS